jgi:hypothetical protein
VDYVHLTQVRDHSRALLNMVMAGRQSASQEGLCSMGFIYRPIRNGKNTNEWKSYVKQASNINCSQSVFSTYTYKPILKIQAYKMH